MFIEILSDGLFASIAAIGFASISNPPRRIYPYCALVAAVGHALRFVLTSLGMHIIPASSLAAFSIGLLAVLLSPRFKSPAETCFFPALLPMIPGMYAYRTFAALLFCMKNNEESIFNHYFYLFSYNGLTCALIVLGMVIGVNIPIFLLKNTSFQATRN